MKYIALICLSFVITSVSASAGEHRNIILNLRYSDFELCDYLDEPEGGVDCTQTKSFYYNSLPTAVDNGFENKEEFRQISREMDETGMTHCFEAEFLRKGNNPRVKVKKLVEFEKCLEW